MEYNPKSFKYKTLSFLSKLILSIQMILVVYLTLL